MNYFQNGRIKAENEINEKLNNVGFNNDQKKIEQIKRKIQTKQDQLSIAKEKRKMSGQKGVQSDKEIKLSSEISDLRIELYSLEK
jgi:hypothetical protein